MSLLQHQSVTLTFFYACKPLPSTTSYTAFCLLSFSGVHKLHLIKICSVSLFLQSTFVLWFNPHLFFLNDQPLQCIAFLLVTFVFNLHSFPICSVLTLFLCILPHTHIYYLIPIAHMFSLKYLTLTFI